eukprot:Platyproteum_vivax@DN3713_c0_g1_i1.p1
MAKRVSESTADSRRGSIDAKFKKSATVPIPPPNHVRDSRRQQTVPTNSALMRPQPSSIEYHTTVFEIPSDRCVQAGRAGYAVILLFYIALHMFLFMTYPVAVFGHGWFWGVACVALFAHVVLSVRVANYNKTTLDMKWEWVIARLCMLTFCVLYTVFLPARDWEQFLWSATLLLFQQSPAYDVWSKENPAENPSIWYSKKLVATCPSWLAYRLGYSIRTTTSSTTFFGLLSLSMQLFYLGATGWGAGFLVLSLLPFGFICVHTPNVHPTKKMANGFLGISMLYTICGLIPTIVILAKTPGRPTVTLCALVLVAIIVDMGFQCLTWIPQILPSKEPELPQTTPTIVVKQKTADLAPIVEQRVQEDPDWGLIPPQIRKQFTRGCSSAVVDTIADMFEQGETVQASKSRHDMGNAGRPYGEKTSEALSFRQVTIDRF